MVQALNTMAALNPAVRSDTMDGALFQAEVEARGVMAVPAVFLNGQFFASGRMELVDVLEKLGAFDDADEAQTISEQAPFDVLVVGGGP
ncbi:MAG: thioredoxin family protein, partial [Tepidimonas ignava]